LADVISADCEFILLYLFDYLLIHHLSVELLHFAFK
jgi:hypothetical protein